MHLAYRADLSPGTRPAPQPRVLLPAGPMPAAAALGSVVHTLGGRTMGTTWQVRLAGPRGLDTERLRPGIVRVLDRVIAQMSAWEPTSDLSRYAAAPAGSRVALPADFATVMRCALHVAERSGGAYDPSAAPLVDAWGFGPRGGWRQPDFAPPTDAILAALPIGWQALTLDTGNRLLQPGGHALDLNAVAKGYAVDAVAEHLRAHGLPNHLVEIGGELRGSGLKPDGQPWWVGIEPPSTDCPLPPTRLALSGAAVATSGDYRRRFQHEGQHCPHTIDPRTRHPVRHGLASVSVLHASSMWADAWSTALTVLGPADGLALATAEGLAALLQWRQADGTWAEAASPAWQELMT